MLADRGTSANVTKIVALSGGEIGSERGAVMEVDGFLRARCQTTK